MQFGVSECVAHWGRYRPSDTALRTLNQSVSYGELNRAIDKYWLLIDSKDFDDPRIGLAVKSRVDFVISLVAILRAGRSVVVVNPGLGDEALRVTLKDAQVQQFLTDEAYARIVTLAPSPLQATAIRLEAHGAASFLSAGAPNRRPSDEWGVLYSSGTTGTPKGIERDHDSMVTELLGWCLELGLNRRTTFYVGRPVFYTGGLVLTLSTLITGGTVWLSDYKNNDDPIEVWLDYQSALECAALQYAFFIPDQIRAFCRFAREGPGAPRHADTILVMGAPITGAEKAQARRVLGSQIVESWGNSESLGTITDPEDLDIRSDSIGRPFLSDELWVVGDDRQLLPPMSVGRIAGSKEAGFLRYCSRPEATREAKQEELIISEDLGHTDEDGYFYIHGRLQEAIVREGETVFVPQIETRLRDIVESSALCLVPTGEQEAAVFYCLVAATAAGGSDPSQLLKWVNGELSPLETLTGLYIVDALPMLPSGKIDRVAAQGMLRDLLDRDGLG